MTISEHDKAWYKAKVVGQFMPKGQRAKFENIAEQDAQMLFKIFQDLDIGRFTLCINLIDIIANLEDGFGDYAEQRTQSRDIQYGHILLDFITEMRFTSNGDMKTKCEHI